ncbi:MAG: DUF2256 domain-containing protein [Phycisphaerae bacterium]|nr:DUF2256 domain-containing protein [Phycisphaerae bacterium]
MRTQEKPCACCGRRITWRKKWQRDWHAVKYCSDRCRRFGEDPHAAELERALLALVERAGGDGSIDPCDAARAVARVDAASLRNSAIVAARRLAQLGLVRLTQGGRTVDGSTVRGDFRVRRP